MFFLTASVISFIGTIIYGVVYDFAKNETQKFLQRCSIIGLILIPVVGLGEGTFYSHGFDIHWSIFGVANFLIILITAFALIGLIKLHGIFTKK